MRMIFLGTIPIIKGRVEGAEVTILILLRRSVYLS